MEKYRIRRKRSEKAFRIEGQNARNCLEEEESGGVLLKTYSARHTQMFILLDMM